MRTGHGAVPARCPVQVRCAGTRLEYVYVFVCAQGEPEPVTAAGIVQASAPGRAACRHRCHRQVLFTRGRTPGVRSLCDR